MLDSHFGSDWQNAEVFFIQTYTRITQDKYHIAAKIIVPEKIASSLQQLKRNLSFSGADYRTEIPKLWIVGLILPLMLRAARRE
jgi:hypothetical protein